jgi:nicotinamide-nucleotide amidase
MDADLAALSLAIGAAALAATEPVLIATAESCTGGWAAQVITHTAGSSAWFELRVCHLFQRRQKWTC